MIKEVETQEKTSKTPERGMEQIKRSMHAVIEQKLEDMDEELVAAAIRGMLLRDEEEKQNLQ